MIMSELSAFPWCCGAGVLGSFRYMSPDAPSVKEICDLLNKDIAEGFKMYYILIAAIPDIPEDVFWQNMKTALTRMQWRNVNTFCSLHDNYNIILFTMTREDYENAL